MRTVRTGLGWKHWLGSAHPGPVEYYQGYLAHDRWHRDLGLDAPHEPLAAADLARQAAVEGKVHLVQHRLPEGGYSYQATRTRSVNQ